MYVEINEKFSINGKKGIEKNVIEKGYYGSDGKFSNKPMDKDATILRLLEMVTACHKREQILQQKLKDTEDLLSKYHQMRCDGYGGPHIRYNTPTGLPWIME